MNSLPAETHLLPQSLVRMISIASAEPLPFLQLAEEEFDTGYALDFVIYCCPLRPALGLDCFRASGL